MLKVDVLALGMLSCVQKAFTLLRRHYGIAHDLASVPPEDPKVYDMLCRGDSLGVFQWRAAPRWRCYRACVRRISMTL